MKMVKIFLIPCFPNGLQKPLFLGCKFLHFVQNFLLLFVFKNKIRSIPKDQNIKKCKNINDYILQKY